MSTPKELAEKYAKDKNEIKAYPDKIGFSTPFELSAKIKNSIQDFLAGYNAANEWVGVKEQVPEFGVDVICTNEFTEYAIGWYADDNFFNDKVMKVTHWLPLPEKPKS